MSTNPGTEPRTLSAMYFDSLEFLEEEREAFRPYEALADVADEQADVAVEAAHGWTARDLMGHMAHWLEVALAVARELAMSETSPTKERTDREWDERGDAINADVQAAWRAMPIDEVRRRFRAVPGELRGTLTVVPEIRWLKNGDMLRYFLDETIDHENDHRADLAAILDAAGAAAAPSTPES
jgi:uncharacterized damage-inducible protein DinB